MIAVGDKVPSILFKATNRLNTTFDQYRGHWMVLYFYPKDLTPGCTMESCDFRDHEKEFSLRQAIIFGISRDTIASHEKFKEKKQLPFELISDPEEKICQAFDVIKTKSLWGKQIRSIERSTFLIDDQGVVRHIWRKVRVKDHVEAVLQTLIDLQ